MIGIPIYVEAAADEAPDAYFRKGVVSTPLRLAVGSSGAAPGLPIDSGSNAKVAASIVAAAKAAAALPSAATLATIARVGQAARAVERAGREHAPIVAVTAPDLAMGAAYDRDAAALAASPDAAQLETLEARR